MLNSEIIYSKALDCALSMFMSKYPHDMPSDDVLAYMNTCEESGRDLDAERYSVWAPFENYPLDTLVPWISDAADYIESSMNTVHELISNEVVAVDELTENQMKQAVTFTARAERVECPHCGFINRELLGDPRGKEATCDSCNAVFGIAEDAEPIVE